ncbi:hypothetical protein K2173_006289 [Erythroxylum novogranatense]|uniref:BHLH domain-containing protein n=1 Tax=Erythroxylum novogranatense TaxID=1862640 RepID=A0AAV8TEY0_9ROSI|nr:hypothetical protein K2173_006289 [Erythroxylum novogranatense]
MACDYRPSEEISLFLNQILLHSSSPSLHMTLNGPHAQVVAKQNVNASSSSIDGLSEFKTDDCNGESEEGLGTIVDEVPAKQAPPRKSSKRSRPAEVHNLSKKRRRSRINEKMKALLNLIPNSNKFIYSVFSIFLTWFFCSYLKQLQLQVQMLSLRSGISLYPVSVPELLQPIHLSRSGITVDHGNQSQRMSTIGPPLNTDTLPQNMLNLQNQSDHLSANSMLNMINSETPFGLESSVQSYIGPFQLQASCQVMTSTSQAGRTDPSVTGPL